MMLKLIFINFSYSLSFSNSNYYFKLIHSKLPIKLFVNVFYYKYTIYFEQSQRLKTTDDIKTEDIIERILSQITLDDVKPAIRRAEMIRRNKDIADSNLIGNTIIYSNPDFSIH